MKIEINLQSIIEELKKSIEQELPNEKCDIILYGSFARKQSHKNSDIDILIIFDSARDGHKKDTVFGICSNLNTKYDVWIDVSFISRSELNTIKGRQPFVQNALLEGIRV